MGFLSLYSIYIPHVWNYILEEVNNSLQEGNGGGGSQQPEQTLIPIVSSPLPCSKLLSYTLPIAVWQLMHALPACLPFSLCLPCSFFVCLPCLPAMTLMDLDVRLERQREKETCCLLLFSVCFGDGHVVLAASYVHLASCLLFLDLTF